MSSYPPPPPPPGGQYPPPPPGGYPPYDRNAAKAYRQALKMQARAVRMQAKLQRQQLRMQRRSLRRGSIAGPLVLLALGVVFLLAQTGRISWNHIFLWYGSWWPAVLIIVGIVLIAEWMLDQQPGPDGTVRSSRRLGGGVVFLLILLVIFGLSSRTWMNAADRGSEWWSRLSGGNIGNWEHMGDKHDADDSVNSVIGSGATLVIRNPRGDVQVTGSSSDDQVHVSVHKQAWAWKDSDAEEKERQLQPVFSNDGGTLTLSVQSIDGGQADLTIEVPRSTPVTLQANHGDVTVTGLNGALLVSANHGDVDISDITGALSAHINYDNASVSGHNITGAVQLDGRTGDVNLSQITGDVNLQGDFFGNTHLEQVSGQVHFSSTRTLFQMARLDGELDLDGENLDASQIQGPVVVTTRYGKNVTLERTQGSVTINNMGKGSVTVTSTTPLAPISITNQHGSVDVGVPGHAGFTLDASTQHGDAENDFGIESKGENGKAILSGVVDGGGPPVKITTQNGDITVRRSEVEPLPPPKPMPNAKPIPPAKMTPPVPPAPPKVPKGVSF